MIMGPSGFGGQRGGLTSFENWNPTAADVQGMEGSYCRCKIQRERVWGELFRERRLCVVAWGTHVNLSECGSIYF